jgi:hypothetical protein
MIGAVLVTQEDVDMFEAYVLRDILRISRAISSEAVINIALASERKASEIIHNFH